MTPRTWSAGPANPNPSPSPSPSPNPKPNLSPSSKPNPSNPNPNPDPNPNRNQEAGDTAVDIILCNVDKYYRNFSSYAEGRMKYYLGINGGDTCAHYEIITTTFTTSCAEAKAEALQT